MAKFGSFVEKSCTQYGLHNRETSRRIDSPVIDRRTAAECSLDL